MDGALHLHVDQKSDYDDDSSSCEMLPIFGWCNNSLFKYAKKREQRSISCEVGTYDICQLPQLIPARANVTLSLLVTIFFVC